MKSGESEIFESLSAVRWDTAFRTYGNNHSTLIGIIVDWWISLNPQRGWALEAGPTNGCKEKGERGQCDALLCLDGNALGVLEVEGSRHEFAIKKVGTFFDGKNTKIRALSFGLLFFYTVATLGRGTVREYPSPFQPDYVEKIGRVTISNPEKFIILICLEKKYDRTAKGIRAGNTYYMAEPYEISLRLYKGGNEVKCHRITKPNYTQCIK